MCAASTGETRERPARRSPAGGANVYSIVGDFRVTGGTGRFAGAKGSGYLQGTITLGPLVSQAEYQAGGRPPGGRKLT